MAAFDNCPKLLLALSVAYFAWVGCFLRVAITWATKSYDFGITTTRDFGYEHGVEDIEIDDRREFFSHLCIGSQGVAGGAGYFLQNILGCICMAIIARHKKSLKEWLAVGLASGFCGSLTTWATWMGDLSSAIIYGYWWQSFVSVLCMLCVATSSYKIGHYIAGCGMDDQPYCCDEFCGLRTCAQRISNQREARRARKAAARERGNDSDESSTESEDEGVPEAVGADGETGPAAAGLHHAGSWSYPERGDTEWALGVDTPETWAETQPQNVKLSPVMVLLIFFISLVGVTAFLVYTALGFRQGAFFFAFAPLGALLRWWLSRFNPLVAPFPLFTLLANVLGCACNAIAAVMIHDAHAGTEYFYFLTAVSTGFSGCLSTVSTLVAELRSDTIGPLWVRIVYFLLTFVLSMAVLIPIKRAQCAHA